MSQALKTDQHIEFGGVDSRSNPLALPENRSLRCLNWVPRQGGQLEQRWGYDTTGTVSSTIAFHSLEPFTLWDGTSYLIAGQAQGLTSYKISDNTVTSPSFSGISSLGSSSPWGVAPSRNRILIANGNTPAVYDGTKVRGLGLRSPTSSEVVGMYISKGVRELSSSEASTITLTSSAGGSFSTTSIGYLFYVVLFDPSLNEFGPSTINVSSSRVTVSGTGKKITVGNMLTPPSPWVKLIARTGDGDVTARYCINSTSTISSYTTTSTGSPTLTVTTLAPHGLSTNDITILSGTSYDGIYIVNVTGASTFTITLPGNFGAFTGSGGTVERIISASNATASIDVVLDTTSSVYVVNAERGLAPTSIGGSQPGYQFYVSFYNPNSQQHVGNRISIGSRYAPTERANFHINGFPKTTDLGSDITTEIQLCVGRTGDGAQVPYALIDENGNLVFSKISGSTAPFFSVINARSFTAARIDGNSELPTRNGLLPSQCTMLARVGDRLYAADPNSPTIRRSASEADDNTGIFLGDPAQSWAANDIETFPTAKPVRGIAEVDYELFVGTLTDCAILSDQSGYLAWRGPWRGTGIAGSRSFCKTPYGLFWVTGNKTLATFINYIPKEISEEYEAGTLSKIGDAYLGSVTCSYYRNAAQHKDEIRIECQDSTGTPFTVIHDFKIGGQGYTSQYIGPLSSAYVPTRDATDALGNLSCYAGINGTIYKLYSGSSDAGTQFTSDIVGLMNIGNERPSFPFFDWHGDGNAIPSVGRTLSSELGLGEEFSFDELEASIVQGAENDSLYRAKMVSTDVYSHLYWRIRLTSHSADGDLSLNDPPHVPMENYGRIWDIVTALGKGRGR